MRYTAASCKTRGLLYFEARSITAASFLTPSGQRWQSIASFQLLGIVRIVALLHLVFIRPKPHSKCSLYSM